MASYRCLDPMCALSFVEEEGLTDPCPKCGNETEEFFPDITDCDVAPAGQNAADASVLARAISSKFSS